MIQVNTTNGNVTITSNLNDYVNESDSIQGD